MDSLSPKNGIAWDVNLHQGVIRPVTLNVFLDKLETLCQESGISIAHEDGHGSFIFEAYNQPTMDWLKGGNIDFPKGIPPAVKPA